MDDVTSRKNTGTQRPDLIMTQFKDCDLSDSEKIFCYFMLKKTDVDNIVTFFHNMAKESRLYTTYQEFISVFHLKDNLLFSTLFSYITLQTKQLTLEPFVRFILYYGILDVENMLQQTLKIVGHSAVSKVRATVFEDYLSLLPPETMSIEEKNICLKSYQFSQCNLKIVTAQFLYKYRKIPFVVPLLDLKEAIQKYVLSKRRCELLTQLRSKVFFYLSYKQLHKTNPPFSLCEYWRFFAYKENPYDCDYILPYDELESYELPSLIQSTCKDRKISAFNREVHISRNPSSTIRNLTNQSMSNTGFNRDSIELNNNSSILPRRRISAMLNQRTSRLSTSVC